MYVPSGESGFSGTIFLTGDDTLKLNKNLDWKKFPHAFVTMQQHRR